LPTLLAKRRGAKADDLALRVVAAVFGAAILVAIDAW
jgi:hypothetical protein